MAHRKIAPGVLVVETQVADGKAGVIAGSDIALAVDAGIDDIEGAAVRAAAESLGRPDIQLVFTHGHTDHALGGTAFAGQPIHARREVSAYMHTQLEAWAARGDETVDRLAGRLGWPTHEFRKEATLDLGQREVHLIDSPGHAPGAICVFDARAGVLFGGDTIVTAIPPAFNDGDAAVLEQTLRRLAELDVDILIPGHGSVITDRHEARAAIAWSADYLARCRSHIETSLEQGEAAVLAGAPYDEYIGDHLPRDHYRMEWRHEQTLRTMLRQRMAAIH
jgi:glyoxylase-like metal-dependent hydrolase (beta-lactamase superfamily II)